MDGGLHVGIRVRPSYEARGTDSGLGKKECSVPPRPRHCIASGSPDASLLWIVVDTKRVLITLTGHGGPGTRAHRGCDDVACDPAPPCTGRLRDAEGCVCHLSTHARASSSLYWTPTPP